MSETKSVHLYGREIQTAADIRELAISKRAQDAVIDYLTKRGIIKDAPDSLKEHWKSQDKKREQYKQNPYSVT